MSRNTVVYMNKLLETLYFEENVFCIFWFRKFTSTECIDIVYIDRSIHID